MIKSLMSQLKLDGESIPITYDQTIAIVMTLRDCNEAIKAFPDMTICPSCETVIDRNGVMVHKERETYIN